MATVINSKTRKCDVIYNGAIAELGFISGPVYNCKLTTSQIDSLIRHGKIVFEIDPRNPLNKVKLDIGNYKKSPFGNVQEVKPLVDPLKAKDLISKEQVQIKAELKAAPDLPAVNNSVESSDELVELEEKVEEVAEKLDTIEPQISTEPINVELPKEDIEDLKEMGYLTEVEEAEEVKEETSTEENKPEYKSKKQRKREAYLAKKAAEEGNKTE